MYAKGCGVRIVTKKRIVEFYRKHPDARRTLEGWHSIVRRADWKSLAEVRAVFPGADPVLVASRRTVTVFNICGNKYRLLAALHYNRSVAYILAIMTHAEYGRGDWKAKL